MQILRLPPYPISITYDVPLASTQYAFVIDDVENQSTTQQTVTSTVGKKVTLELPVEFSKYDKSYSLAIYRQISQGVLDDEPVVEDNLDITRPYVDPASLGITATEIAQYTEQENLARTIIDNITGGFYNKKTYLETVGQGTDYIPLWDRTNKILKVYENAELVYDVDSEDGPALGDYNFLITKDKTAITKDPVVFTDAINRAERKNSNMFVAPSDSFALFDTEDSGNIYTIHGGVGFNEGYDYIFLLETGYKVVPYDIQDATRMLIEDIRCGKLDYYKRYVTSYNTDQFKIQFDKKILDGTGNILVDKILSKYTKSIVKLGVL
jgi:hypothetical protein